MRGPRPGQRDDGAAMDALSAACPVLRTKDWSIVQYVDRERFELDPTAPEVDVETIERQVHFHRLPRSSRHRRSSNMTRLIGLLRDMENLLLTLTKGKPAQNQGLCRKGNFIAFEKFTFNDVKLLPD